MTITFVVYGEAKPAGSKRHIGGGRIVDANPGAKEWKRQVAQAAGEHMNGGELLRGAVYASFVFYVARPKGHYRTNGEVRASAPRYPTTRPDTTKLVRNAEDALTGIIVADDSQIVSQHARKEYGEPARLEITVTPLGEEQ